ncbi:MAG: N-acetyltransferase [Gemmatimonadota bacterium]
MHLPLPQCTIRSWRPADAARLATVANDRDIWIMVRDRFPHPYTLADADAFIARVLAEEPERNFAVAVDDAAVGGVVYMPGEDIHRVSAEVGYWLGADARGRGIATEAVRAFVGWIWENTEIQHLEAGVFTYNPASARVLEKVGFTLAYTARSSVIKDGTLRDEWVYTINRR